MTAPECPEGVPLGSGDCAACLTWRRGPPPERALGPPVAPYPYLPGAFDEDDHMDAERERRARELDDMRREVREARDMEERQRRGAP